MSTPTQLKTLIKCSKCNQNKFETIKGENKTFILCKNCGETHNTTEFKLPEKIRCESCGRCEFKFEEILELVENDEKEVKVLSKTPIMRCINCNTEHKIKEKPNV